MKKQKNTWKQITLTLIATTLLLSIVNTTNAETWTQYTPSPTANDIQKIRTYSTTAMAKTTLNNILFYNGTTWTEITNPDTNFTNAIDFDKATDGQFHWAFQNASSHVKYYTYNPITQTWTLQNTQALTSFTPGSTTNSFGCIHEGSGYTGTNTDAECWLLLDNDTTIPYASAITLTPLTSVDTIITGTRAALITSSFGAGTYQYFNGISYIAYPAITGIRDTYEDNTPFVAIISFNANLFINTYNATTSTFTSQSDGASPFNAIAIKPSEAQVYYAHGTGLKQKSYYQTATPNLVFNTTTQINDIDFDVDNKKAWVAGNNGLLITNDVASGGQTTTPVQLAYTINNYTSTNNTITNIEGVQPITNTKSYAITKKDNKLAIISYDYNNPNSIEVENLTTTSTATPRGIHGLGDKIILGTTSNTKIYNNTDPEDVTQLNLFAEPQSSLFPDDTISVYSATAYDAYACDTRLTDELIRYNTTDGTILNTTDTTCYDISSNNDGSTIYAHTALDGINIYNSELSLQNTLDIITSFGSNNPTDLLSLYADKMSIVTGRNVIKTYDLTNPTNPSLLWECRASQDITSIESLNANVIIVGTETSIQVCNKEDTSLYDTGGNYYITKQLKTNPAGVIQRDIRRTGTPLAFVAAETNQFTYYQIQIGDLASINLAPIINSVSINDDTPCINQTIYGHITATDPDTPGQITIQYDCNGGTDWTTTTNGDINCQYTTSGIKTIKVNVTDLYSSTTQNKIVSVGTCIVNVDQHPLTIIVRDYITTNPISGATINVQGYTSIETDTEGIAYTELPSPGIYNVTITKAGYVTLTGTAQTGNARNIAELQPINVQNENGTTIARTILIIHVQDQQGQPISEALTSATDQITTIARLATTNTNGDAYTYDLATGTPITISAGKTNYISQFTTTTLQQGEQKTITITLLTTTQTNNQTTARGCQDYIDGLWLCSPLNTTANGDNCQNDADCISGRCQIGMLGTTRTCAIFNYTKCDAAGQERGNKCFLGQMTLAAGKGLVKIILKNFLYFALFVIIIILALIIAGRYYNKTP